MKVKLFILFSFALIFRFGLSFVAHHGDLNNNISWGQELHTRGIVDYYGSSDANDWPYSAPNQPPLYVLLFGANHTIAEAKEDAIFYLNENVGIFPSKLVWTWEEKGLSVVYKMFPVWADLGIGFLIFFYFVKKGKGQRTKGKDFERLGLILATVWLLNPVSWYNSAIWGQTDPIVNFLGLIAIFGLLGVFGELGKLGRLGWFAIWFTIATLFKGSLLIFVPVLAVVFVKQKYKLKEWLFAGVYSVVIIFLSSIWFHPRFDFPLWFIDLYQNRILPGEIGYLTANAFNLWWLVDPGKVHDSIAFLGLPVRAWGMMITVSIFASVCYMLWKKIPSKKWEPFVYDKLVFLGLAISAAASFLFMTRIHERYLYPFFPVSTILIGLIPGMILPYVIFSITYLLNMYHLFWAPPIPFIEMAFKNTLPAKVLSMVNIFTSGLLLRLLPKQKV